MVSATPTLPIPPQLRPISMVALVMCASAFLLIVWAYVRVGTVIGHDDRSLFGWLILYVALLIGAVDRWRDIGFLVGPFLLGICVTALQYVTTSRSHWPLFGVVIYFTLVAIPASYALAFAVGVPVLALLQRAAVLRAAYYIVAGAAVGLLLGIAFMFVVSVENNYSHSPMHYRSDVVLPFGFLGGAFFFLVYWQLSIRARVVR